MNPFYITTPIYYVNAEPHIGTAYTTLVADTLARYFKQQNGAENVYFLTGTDENSQKTIDAAEKMGLPVPEYLEKMAERYKSCWQSLAIEQNDFIRTTEDRHIKGVEMIFNRIAKYNPTDVYKGKYEGKYCHKCETFLKEEELIEGNCPDHGTKPEKLIEENYFFRLSKYSDQLKTLLQKNLLTPEKRKNEMLAFLEKGLEDISITRETAKIGIPYPLDPQHKLYVWVEAVMNYVSALETPEKQEKFWGKTDEQHGNAMHLIGKDITRFHTLIWPALLLSSNLPLPKKVLAHGFFTVNGQKMSKSLGNAIHPVELAEKYGKDALRMGLLTAFELGNDGDFSLQNFELQYNAKLAGGLGNLFYRTTHLAKKLMQSQKPTTKAPDSNAKKYKTTFQIAIETFEIKKAYETLFQTVDAANIIMNNREPWKHKEEPEYIEETFAQLIPFLHATTQMAIVLLPEKADAMKKMLGDEKTWGEPEILYKKIEALTQNT